MAVADHRAAHAALGYLYQVQWPLLELAKRTPERPDFAICIELHDDVAWEHAGTPTELLQLKHHSQAVRTLGDKDADLWRTIRVWMDVHPPGDANGPLLTLVTTQTATERSAAAALRPGTAADPLLAQRLLEAAAAESTAEASQETRRRFLALPAADREIFVRRMRVLDNSPGIGNLDQDVRRELHHALPQGHEGVFMDLLWSWWHQRAIDMLQDRRTSVNALDLSSKVSDLRDQFTRDHLPTLVADSDFDTTTEPYYVDRPFVHQLRWVQTPSANLTKAIIDYYRAYTQTARWVDADLVGVDELEGFEKRLQDEWEREFDWMVAELPPSAEGGRPFVHRPTTSSGFGLRRDSLNSNSATTRR